MVKHFTSQKGEKLYRDDIFTPDDIGLYETEGLYHSLTAYNNRTPEGIMRYWIDNFSNNLRLTESAIIKGEYADFPFSSRVYAKLTNDTPIFVYSPYDNYSVSEDIGRGVLKNLKYATRGDIIRDPKKVRRDITLKNSDYGELLISISPANIE